MKNAILFLLVMALTSFICGCGDTERTADVVVVPGACTTNETRESYSALKDADVLVAIGDRRLTKKTLESKVREVRDAILAREKSANAYAEYQRKLPEIYYFHLNDFISRSALIQDANRKKVTPGEEDMKLARRIVENKAKAMKLSYDEMCAKVYGGREGVERDILEDATLKAYFRNEFSNSLDVASADVDKLHARLVKANQDSDATNKIYRARLDELRKKLTAELPKLSDDDDANAKLVPSWAKVEYFEDLRASAFEDDELVPSTLSSTPLNTWTSIVELDNSFDIYCVTNFEAKSKSGVASLYTGFKVTCAKDLGYQVPSKQELWTKLKYDRNEAIVSPRIEALKREFGLLYPHGTKWVDDLLKTKRR